MHSLSYLPCRAVCMFILGVVASSVNHAQTPAQTPRPTSNKNAVTYTLSPGDKLNIRVYQETDLNIMTRIDAHGNVMLQLVGEVNLFGKSVADAQKTIEDAYREGRFLRNPQVTISIEETAPRAVTVFGPVKRSGEKILLAADETTDLVDVITKAGGFLDTAKGSAVTVTRINPVDGSRSVLGPFDVESVIKGKARGKNRENMLIMMPDDIVNVPMRMF
jgi:polysaccharide export outer membrane protein